jgi:hypothetical protein
MFLFATNTVGEKEAAQVAEEILIRIDAVIEIREEIRGLAAGGIAVLKMIICVHAGISF